MENLKLAWNEPTVDVVAQLVQKINGYERVIIFGAGIGGGYNS